MERAVALYRKLQRLVKQGQIQSEEILDLFIDLYAQCQKVLSRCEKVSLISKVPEKEYFSFKGKTGISRAVNVDVYSSGTESVDAFLSAIKSETYNAHVNYTDACYAIVISFCAIIDIMKVGDQKTPGTFFEYFVGHLYSRRVGVAPTKQLPVLNLDMEGTLPTDFIFDRGRDMLKFHVPVKLSTRERVIQVWAHQRVLDGIYGTGRFIGTLVCLCETKTDKKTKEVVEICLPFQWRLYQMFISQLKRIYYLDMPQAYTRLNLTFPKIKVCPFGDFFLEADSLLE